MKLKLFFKQSFKDLIVYWPLYVTFTLFLAFAISLSLGLISFISMFGKDIESSFGSKYNANARFVAQRYTIPEEKEKANEDFFQEEKSTLPIYNFFYDAINFENKEIWEKIKSLSITHDSITTAEDQNNPVLKFIYKYFANNGGNIVRLNESDVRLSSISNIFHTPSHQQMVKNVDILNKIVDYISHIFKAKFKTNNIQSAFIIDQYLKQDLKTDNGIDKFYFQFIHQSKGNLRLENMSQKISLDSLVTNEKMGDIHQGYYGNKILEKISDLKNPEMKIPNYKLFWNNQFNRINFQTSIDFESDQFKNYLDRTKEEFGMFFYMQPKSANEANFKLGEKYKVFVGTDEKRKTHELLYAGTILNPDLWYLPNEWDFYTPAQTINKIFYETSAEQNTNTNQTEFQKYWNSAPNAITNIIYLLFPNSKNTKEGQGHFSNWFETYLMEHVNANGNAPKLQSATVWSDTDTNTSALVMLRVFIGITIVIVVIVLMLLFLIFFFISHQIILLQQKNLFCLKSIGIRNHELSTLTTFALILPTLVSFTIGIFGSLAVQSILMDIVYEFWNYYHSFWTFGFEFIIAFVGLMLVCFAGFFIISLLIINSDALKISGMSVAKGISHFQMKMKFLIKGWNPKLRLGFAFAFQNVYKNIVSYVILTFSFAVFLFSFQFNSSIKIFNNAPEIWNAPYKSIKLNHSLPLFNIEDKLIDSYKTIDVNEIKYFKPLDKDFWTNPTGGTVLEKLNKIEDMKSTYIPKETVLWFLDEVIKKPKYYDQILSQANSFFAESNLAKNTQNKNPFKSFIDQLLTLRLQIPSFKGINIMFGNVVGSINQKTIPEGKQRGIFTTRGFDRKDSLYVDLIAFENDEESKKHFEYNVAETDSNVDTTFESSPVLKVGISNFYAKRANLKVGDQKDIGVNIGFKTDKGAIKPIAHNIKLKVNKIVKNTLSKESSIYVPQKNLFAYLEKINRDKQIISQKFGQIVKDMKKAEPVYISNSYFSQQNLPMQLEYFTLPIFHSNGEKIQDYYSKNTFERYLNSIIKNVLIFSVVTQKMEEVTQGFAGILKIAIFMSSAIAIIVSVLVTILILLENRRTILLFKTIGYRKSEINKYLISGYFVSMAFAVLTAIGIVWFLLEVMKNDIASLFWFNLELSFTWTPMFIAILITSITAFFVLINAAISTYTKRQQPKHTFEDL
ncbi:hypothetical protein ELUMI_v1c02100 [Williamsoniiplasma luminosum]|uniref:ABC3 transporter permease C-terminal domain-containing protein n=1 Tax=Williamsoniiplasma luminosum TaxID=214888 RepID=A0A2K8NSV8_9MOLU|nr:ABC transporter permease [Williamsoniiplasma luminosum]ATZ16935.1 hypothetical protein ELUMI_v1c02100 [Williamsoniiplasma luminosum]